jgi:hypothetical protein
MNRRTFLLARLKAMQAIRKAREQIQQVKNVTNNPGVPTQAPTPNQPERFGGFNGSGFQS